MVYVSSSVQDMYLSYESLLNLGLLSSDFPFHDSGASPCDRCHPGQHDAPLKLPTTNATRSLNDGCSIPTPQYGTACSCPQRQAPPPRPSELPFPCTPENNGRIKAWLLNRYASSTFNTCPDRPLPCKDHQLRYMSILLPHPRPATPQPTFLFIGSSEYTRISSVTRL